MALREATVPAAVLYHVGRNPDPLAWVEWRYVGGGRFDDPKRPRTFRVLYAAEQRLAAFVETLPKFRRSIEALAALQEIVPARGEDFAAEDTAGAIPADWHLKRMIGALRLLPGQRLLDLREHETRETLRVELAPTLQRLGYKDFDLSDALSRNRRLTKPIARFAEERGFRGIAYTSRFDITFDCLAIFEGAEFEALERRSIERDDPDLIEAARRHNLRWA